MEEKIDLVSLPKKSFWKLSVPIMVFCIFDAIYGIVDMVWVSRISVEAFFAMGVSIIGSVASAVILFVFMGKYGYISTLLFIVVGIEILYIKLIAKKLGEEDE